MGRNTKGLNSSVLKYIAIIAMLLDHIGFGFLLPESVTYQVMRFIGRITAPLMCFFLTEGFHHTKDVKKYLQRLIVFAFISQIPYTWFFTGKPFAVAQSGLNVIATLAMTLAGLYVYNSEKIANAYKLPIILLFGTAAGFCDWGLNIFVITFVFEFSRNDRSKQPLAYAAAAFFYAVPTFINYFVSCIENGEFAFYTSFYKFGVFLPILFIKAYNGERGGGKYGKWVFYIFYPAHLLVLTFLSYKLT